MKQFLKRQRRFAVASLAFVVSATGAALVSGTVSAEAATSWYRVSAPAPATGWSSVSFVHDHWIALSHGNKIAESSNANHWVTRLVPAGQWQSVAYGAGRFVALSVQANSSQEMTSTTGVAWTKRSGPGASPPLKTQPSQYGYWTSIAYGDGIFAAVSAVGTVYTSPNGISWTERFFWAGDDFTSVTFGAGRFVAVDATRGDVMLSSNGTVWGLVHQPRTGPTLTPAAGMHYGAVAYGNGNFVAFGGTPASAGYVATSVYGNTWALHRYLPAQKIDAASFGCGTFYAAGNSSTTVPVLMSSTLGQQWMAHPTSAVAPSTWTSVAYGNGRFVGVTSRGGIAVTVLRAHCGVNVPLPPQQVSGNVHSGQVWTYMHPSPSPGSAPIEGYRVTVSDGVTSKMCAAAVYYQPNCIVAGLLNHHEYWVTAQAYNRYGLSAPTDPEFVIPVANWSLSAAAPVVIDVNRPTTVEVTGILANAAGFYPVTTVDVYFGSRLVTCTPNPFGECVIPIGHLRVGRVDTSASYVGYGRYYRSPTHTSVVVAAS